MNQVKISSINAYLQHQLNERGMPNVTAVEAAEWLDQAGILKDSIHRPGLPLRNLLRQKPFSSENGRSPIADGI